MAVVAAGGLAACKSPDSDSGSSTEIVIGASIPLSGPLADFGAKVQWGYQHAVDEVNDAGGIEIDGTKRQVRLVILDDETDPNVSVNNIQQLVTDDHVDALLGSCTDPLVVPGAILADKLGVPYVTGCAAVDNFGSTQEWTWAWDLFFDANDLTEVTFKTVEELGLDTNKKVAIIHSNGLAEDKIGGELWPKYAEQYGWEVVYNEALPPDTSQFTSSVEAAKATGADMLLAVFPPPAAIALRTQMETSDYHPKLVAMEEGGEPQAFADALGPLAEGVLVGGYWDPSFPYEGAAELRETFESETGDLFSQHIADSAVAAEVLLQAIERAGTLDKAKVNDEIGKTDATFLVGPVKFGEDHTSTLPMVELQWQGGANVVVGPKEFASGDLIFPLP